MLSKKRYSGIPLDTPPARNYVGKSGLERPVTRSLTADQ
jgi:hypothetical protein